MCRNPYSHSRQWLYSVYLRCSHAGDVYALEINAEASGSPYTLGEVPLPVLPASIEQSTGPLTKRFGTVILKKKLCRANGLNARCDLALDELGARWDDRWCGQKKLPNTPCGGIGEHS